MQNIYVTIIKCANLHFDYYTSNSGHCYNLQVKLTFSTRSKILINKIAHLFSFKKCFFNRKI